MSHSSTTDATELGLLILQDESQPCPYLPGQTARLPLCWPRRKVSASELDRFLELGYRRSGPLVYRTACLDCQACEATRVELQRFQSTRSQRRVEKRGDRLLQVQPGYPQLDSQRVELFNRHRQERGLDHDGTVVDEEAYRSFLVETCCPTWELTFWLEDELVGVATFDLGQISMSAVYTYFRPDLKQLSLGTYAILKSIDWARQHGLRWYYLGFFVAENRHLNYKSRFLPQQRYRDGQWQTY